ncbi:Uncharacterised protein [Vibrio cholerae]|nr:Uncharacterised protein [Vibrio cholerae]
MIRSALTSIKVAERESRYMASFSNSRSSCKSVIGGQAVSKANLASFKPTQAWNTPLCIR